MRLVLDVHVRQAGRASGIDRPRREVEKVEREVDVVVEGGVVREMGDPEKVVSRGSLANPEALDAFSEFARRLAAEATR